MAAGRVRLFQAARTLYPHNPLFDSDGLVAIGRTPAGPVAWNVPARLARFVGREDLLAVVDGELSSPSRLALVALDGMGGVGKTSLAVEYAHRWVERFDVVWWVPSERAELVEQRLAELAEPLGLKPGLDADAVWSALRAVSSWLVVFDNVEEIAAVERFQPSGGGRVLVTSRRRAARRLGSSVTVTPFDRDASVRLLAARVPNIDRAAAGRVAELVGDLPLAVETAAGYLDETEIPADEYANLLASRPELTLGDPWQLSAERLREQHPAAAELLELFAWCAADPVPLSMLTADSTRLGGALSRAASEDVAWADTVGALVGYSLARRDGDALVVHRLVAAAARRTMSAERSSQCVGVLAEVMRVALPGKIWGNPAGWPVWRILLPHALTIAGYARGERGRVFEDGCWLADRAATYLEGHGQLSVAIPIFERTLTDAEKVLGGDHPDTLTSRNNLAGAYRSIGRVEQAINLFEQTLADRQRILGDEHPDTLTSRHSLAGAYRAVGRVAQAISLYERTLSDAERVLGDEHPDTLTLRNNLAGAYQAAGQAEEAISLFERTLADRERVLGDEHPDTLTSRNNLAYAVRAAGRIGQAIGLFERTLADRERVLGDEHPDTLTSRHSLAYAYQAAGQVGQAISLYERTLADRERVLGDEHPDTLTSRNNLAYAYQAAGQVEQAVSLFERTLADRERVLGDEHPDTLTSRNNLAGVHAATGRVEQAIGLFERTLTDREHVLGGMHPDTLTSRNNLAYAYQAAGRVEQAIGLFERTLTDREHVLGGMHPDTLTSRNNLAYAYQAAGWVEQAISLYERTVADAERVLETGHPSLTTFRSNLEIASLLWISMASPSGGEWALPS